VVVWPSGTEAAAVVVVVVVWPLGAEVEGAVRPAEAAVGEAEAARPAEVEEGEEAEAEAEVAGVAARSAAGGDSCRQGPAEEFRRRREPSHSSGRLPRRAPGPTWSPAT
jgi:hypothetical protein